MDSHPDFYDYPPYRPPNEANSALIRITRGCPWNKCTFCSMYKKVRFEIKPVEEIQECVKAAREIFGPARTVFLGDSDNLVHENLPGIIAYIREIFPEAKRITAYARAHTILRQKQDFLKKTRQSGLSRLHIGLESGDPTVLKRFCKGATPGEMAGAGLKAKKAGFEVSFYVLSGAGGTDWWKEHAVRSAKVLNKAKPDFIRLRTLTVLNGTPIEKKLASGEFELTPPLERLKEIKLFVETLKINNCFLASDHLTNYLWMNEKVVYRGIAGELPSDKDRMLEILEKAIASVKSSPLDVKDSNALYREGAIYNL